MIGIDFDGVIYDIGQALSVEASNLLGREIHVNEITKYGLIECLHISEKQVRYLIDQCWEDRWFNSSMFISGAVEGLNQFLNLNQPIIIITARPHPERVKEYLLSHLNVGSSDLLVYTASSQNKGAMARDLNITVFVDDHFVSLDSVSRYDIEPILYDAPWNQFPTEYRRVKGWNEINEIVLKMRENNESGYD